MGKELLGSYELNRVYQMDCLEGMKLIPSKSVNLICIDPPYNIGKDKTWDKWKKQSDYVEWMGEVFKECERVLADNGSFYYWHNDFNQIVELQNYISQNTQFQFRQFIVWDKYHGSEWNQLKAIVYSEENRNYPKQAEYCLFFTFQDGTGLDKVKLDMNNFKTLRNYFEGLQKYLGTTKKAILEKIGQRADHCFRWGSSQWDLPTEATYNALIGEFEINSWEGFKTYEELRSEYEELRSEYEEQRYVFNNPELPSIWQHGPVKQNGHITPKPVKLIENIIETSSNKGDIVLDCFGGSGTTFVAAERLNRKWIGFEREPKYIEITNQRLEAIQDEIAEKKLTD